jgi:hypothetical protein
MRRPGVLLVNAIAVVSLSCGHERWAPLDWDGRAEVTCHECVGFDNQGEPPLRGVISSEWEGQ